MPVQHNHYADPTNKVGCDQWNEEHKIVNMLGYELVEEKILPAGTTSCVFDGLNGDVDEEYLIVCDILIAGTSDRTMFVIPDTGVGSEFVGYSHAAGGQVSVNGVGFPLVPPSGGRMYQYVELRIFAKSGKFRHSYGFRNGWATDGSWLMGEQIHGLWKNSTSLIGALTVGISIGGSFSGLIKLYKKIP